MRRAVAAIPALAVTLALFFLMQLLIAPSGREIPKPIIDSGVGLVTLLRDSADGSAQGAAHGALPAIPAASSEPPPPPPMTTARIATPPEPAVTTDVPAPEAPVLDALPFLGGPPVAAAKRPLVSTRPKPAKKRPRTRKSDKTDSSKRTKDPRSARTTASSKGRGESAATARGRKTTGRGRGSGDTRGKSAKSSGNSPVVVLSRPKPAYPRDALRNKKEGWVKISFTITEKGTVTNPRVVAAKPRRVFDRSALQAIRKWRFKPKTVGGRPVRTKATQLIEFNLARR